MLHNCLVPAATRPIIPRVIHTTLATMYKIMILCEKLNFIHIFFTVIQIYIFLQKLVQTTVRFRFDGQPITENDTPQGLEMEDGDTIEVFQQQTGGFFLSHLVLL